MRTYLYRDELLSMTKNDLSCGIKYLKKHNVMSLRDIELEISKFAQKFIKIDKLSLIFGKDLTAKNRATMQGLELICDICYMLGSSDSSCITEDMLDDSFINSYLDFKRDQEKERNTKAIKEKNGFVSNMYQHLDDNENLMEI